jgi:hypothetical protein
MKKTLALGIGVVGAIFLGLSLTVFGMGAAATLNPTATNSASAPSAEPSVAPADVTAPTPTAAPVTPDGTDSETTHSSDPLTSDKFRALTPDEQANGREWMETQTITATCMKDQGYAYTFEPYWEREQGVMAEPWGNTLPTSEERAADLALFGDTGAGADYHWDEAGCWGYAVHVMGNDNAH